MPTSSTPVAGAAAPGGRNHGRGLGVPTHAVYRPTESTIEIADLRAFAGKPVRLRLADGSEHHGLLRTELLSDRSISIFIARAGGEGETIYIDDITGIWPLD